MKFAGQVASYQNKLRRRSRFFSSLMLVSGISLAGVAPFLSYEVSNIECNEKGSTSAPDFSGEVTSLKTSLEGKDREIDRLEQKVNDQNQEIRELAKNPDCDDLLRVIENERERMDSELTDLRTESFEKDNNIDELRDQLERCIIEKSEISSATPDCDRYNDRITELQAEIRLQDDEINTLNSRKPITEKCPAVSLSSILIYNESFIYNGDVFKISLTGDDVGRSSKFTHNNKDVTSSIRTNNKKVASYTYQGKDDKKYRMTFGDAAKAGGVKFKLVSL